MTTGSEADGSPGRPGRCAVSTATLRDRCGNPPAENQLASVLAQRYLFLQLFLRFRCHDHPQRSQPALDRRVADRIAADIGAVRNGWCGGSRVPQVAHDCQSGLARVFRQRRLRAPQRLRRQHRHLGVGGDASHVVVGHVPRPPPPGGCRSNKRWIASTCGSGADAGATPSRAMRIACRASRPPAPAVTSRCTGGPAEIWPISFGSMPRKTASWTIHWSSSGLRWTRINVLHARVATRYVPITALPTPGGRCASRSRCPRCAGSAKVRRDGTHVHRDGSRRVDRGRAPRIAP